MGIVFQNVPDNEIEVLEEDWLEQSKTVGFLSLPEDLIVMANRGGNILFDTEDEMLNHYKQIVDEGGPTELNPYSGPYKTFAMTCSPDGEFLDEDV